MARGWCGAHYKRWYKYGDPLGTPPKQSDEEAYLSRFEQRGPDECWPWTAGKFKKGYGKFSRGNKKFQAHVFGWKMRFGSIPEGLVIDHVCHNDSGCAGGDSCLHRACQNPAHWELVTPAVNTKRGQGGARLRNLTHCKNGHEFTEENTYRVNGTRRCRQCQRDNNKTPERRAYFAERARRNRAAKKDAA